jgi:hypothetical protein
MTHTLCLPPPPPKKKHRSGILERCLKRLEWDRARAREAQALEDELEKERVAMQQVRTQSHDHGCVSLSKRGWARGGGAYTRSMQRAHMAMQADTTDNRGLRAGGQGFGERVGKERVAMQQVHVSRGGGVPFSVGRAVEEGACRHEGGG